MPVVRLYQHGMTAGVPPRKNDHQRVPRGDVGGWSDAATRRNVRFLYSVLDKELDGHGYAVTLTVRDCPPTADAWHKMRRAFIRRCERAGMVRLHWVTEWQRRGVPHLHGAMYFPAGTKGRRGESPNLLIWDAWDAVARPFGAQFFGQHIKPISDSVGWFQYLSKHAARGVSHYQRSSENVPKAWQQRTGRMWGHVGHWPVREAVVVSLQGSEGDRGFYAFRRLVRSWRLADARADPVAKNRPRRISTARRMLACSERGMSEVRGLSEWVGLDVQDAMLSNLAARGFSVVC